MRKPKSSAVNTMAKHCTFLFHPSILTYFSYAFSQTRSQNNASTLQKIAISHNYKLSISSYLKNLNRDNAHKSLPCQTDF